MSLPASWRNLGTVMVMTIHVAVVACLVRSWTNSASTSDLFFWVAITVGVALGCSWPIGLAIALAFDPAEPPVDRTCLRCGRLEIRPLLRAGADLFQSVSSYRCAACRTIFRPGSGGGLETPAALVEDSPGSDGINFLSDPLDDEEIRFLEVEGEPTEHREHPRPERVG